jgi:REP element-mobilizing transposase RayT
MPDHVHLVVEGRTETSDLRRFAKMAKQRVEHVLRKHFRVYPLWQHGYYERILRTGESTSIAIDYVLNNPAVAGLVKNRRDYPFSGGTRAN